MYDVVNVTIIQLSWVLALFNMIILMTTSNRALFALPKKNCTIKMSLKLAISWINHDVFQYVSDDYLQVKMYVINVMSHKGVRDHSLISGWGGRE